MKTTSSHSEKLVRSEHRTAQFAWPLGVAAAGLAATLVAVWMAHPEFTPVQDWHQLRWGWVAGVMVTVFAAIAFWRARRRPLVRSAAVTDVEFATHNRLETAAALRDAQDAMARAQRAETEQFLQQSQLTPRKHRLVVLGSLVALLVAAHLATLMCWSRPVKVDESKADSPVAQAEKKTSQAEPTASIEWRSPESETSATAIEEVPLEAEATSDCGLRNATLEVEVNGAHRLSQPLPDDLTKPGSHVLKLSIYLDQLDVKTYDIVSYHLGAQRIADKRLPPTSSPVQFVQVKPMREDTFICAGGDQPSKCFNYVTALKAAQLRLMKDNFTLAHAGVSTDSSEWREENSRVGGEQAQLAGRTDDVILLMTTNHYPQPILDLVEQSQPLMTDAAKKIERTENQPALAPQGKALGYLTEVEKYLKSSIKLASNNKQPKAADPFERPKNLELKTHPLTRAGKIDQLAKEQSRLAGDLASGNTNSSVKLASADASDDAAPITGLPGERQSQIKQRIGDFLNDPGFDPEALKHLQSSDDLAGQSQEQIDKNEFAAASEPAAAAAMELQQTAAALRAGGNQAAKNLLADALLKLAGAAGNVRRAAQAKSDTDAAAELKKAEDAVREAARQLAAEAQRQQENGVTNAAQRLNEMANLLQSQSLKQLQAQVQSTPRDTARAGQLAAKLDELSQRAGQMNHSSPLSRQELARLIDQLQRTQANMKNFASQCSGPAAAQSNKSGQAKSGSSGSGAKGEQGQATAGGAAGDEISRARSSQTSRADMLQTEAMLLMDELRLSGMDARRENNTAAHLTQLDQLLRQAAASSLTEPTDFVPVMVELDPPLTGLINTLQNDLAKMRRPFELAVQEHAQTPPAYRAAVADYFEQVSRDYQPAKDGAGNQ